jgi:hypothetical protein
MNRHPLAPAAALVAALALVLAACGGGGTSEATSPPRPTTSADSDSDAGGTEGLVPDLGRFGRLGDCLQLAAVSALSAIGGIGGPPAARRVEQQISGLVADAPPEISEDLAVMADTYRRLAASDPFDPSILEDPAFRQAQTAVQEYAVATCPGGGGGGGG